MAESETDLRNAINDKNFDRKQLPWYQAQLALEDISDEARRLLEEYSGIEREKVVGHVQDVVSRNQTIYICCVLGGQFGLID